jgi:hypothetical protein
MKIFRSSPWSVEKLLPIFSTTAATNQVQTVQCPVLKLEEDSRTVPLPTTGSSGLQTLHCVAAPFDAWLASAAAAAAKATAEQRFSC